MNQRIRSGGLALVFALLVPFVAQTRQGPQIHAALVDEAPLIDAVLDDAVWQRAEVIDNFTQVVPVEGARPTFRTEVRFLTNNESLFISLRAYDAEPDKIVANMMGRGEFFFYDDNFTLVFDTFHDHRNGFFIQVNPLGGRRDGTFERETFEENWDGIWYAKARIDELGWVAEIEIPFRTFSIKPGLDGWGFNMTRRVRRINEESRWADAQVERLLINMSRAGVLDGLAGANQGMGLDVVPSLSVGGQLDSGTALTRTTDEGQPTERVVELIQSDKRELDIEPSFDAFYRLLPSLTSSLTVNTDFSHTEVDDSQVNLTRFNTFFPEKRAFFLEDGGVFSFGGLREENGIPFFSRRIGISDDGDGVRLPVGAKLAGRVGRFSIGALNILQDRSETSKVTNLSVSRLSANILEESTAGFILTHGDPLSNDKNAVMGLDFNYRSNSLVEDRFITGDFWLQQSFSDEGSADYADRSTAWGYQINYPNDKINWSLKYKEIQKGFDPALGFVNRSEIRRYSGHWRYRHRPTAGYFRRIDTELKSNITTDRDDNTLKTYSVHFFPVRMANQVDDTFEIRVVQLYDRVPPNANFFIAPHIQIAEGTYNYPSVIAAFRSSRNRKIRFNLDAGYGGFYDGTGYRLNSFIEWRPSAHFLLSLQYDRRSFHSLRTVNQRSGGAADLDGGRKIDVVIRLARARLRINFTPDISWSTVVQYDNITDEISAQSTFRWIIEAGSDLFLVLGQDFDASPDQFRVGTTRPVVKLSWTYRF